MIITSTVIINNKEYCKHESDTFLIQKVGTEEIYSEATDTLPCRFEYIETDIPLLQELDSFGKLNKQQ